MLSFNKTKLILSFLGTLVYATHAAAAYSTGPYLNLGVGSISISGSGISNTGGAARLGLGYLGAVTDEENPVLFGMELNGDYGYTSPTSSVYGADIAGILGRQLNEQMAIFGKLGLNALGNEKNYVAGPQIGLGIGCQLIPNLRLTAEGDYAFDAIHIGNSTNDHFGNHSNTVNIFNLLLGLQYTFYVTNPATNS
jgi:hypothetical protein